MREKRAGLCCYQLWFVLQYLLSFFLDHLMNYPADGTFGQRSRNVAGANSTKWTNMVEIYGLVAVNFPAENVVVNVTFRYLTHV